MFSSRRICVMTLGYLNWSISRLNYGRYQGYDNDLHKEMHEGEQIFDNVRRIDELISYILRTPVIPCHQITRRRYRPFRQQGRKNLLY